MRFRMMLFLAAAVLALNLVLPLPGGSPAVAGLNAVSGTPDPADDAVPPGGNPALVAISLANGFPLWYGDGNGLKLALCLDPKVEIAPGVVVEPCEVEKPFGAAPLSFPNNFGSEAIYWTAVTAGTYASSNGALNAALLVLAQEASFAAEGPVADGSQVAFSRIRIRVDAPVAGTYRVTHPYGSRDYAVTFPGPRAINQTQDRGGLIALDFLTSMVDGPPPVPPVLPSFSTGAVNADGATVGPFLVPGNNHGGVFDPNNAATFAGGPVTLGGARYIGLPFAPNPANPLLPLPVFQPIDAVGAVDYFQIELLNPPPGFLLDAGGIDGTADNIVRFSNFQLMGKIFDDGPNVAPIALPDVAGTRPGVPVSIDVVLNDTDLPGPGNVHGIDPQAIALVHPGGALVLVLGLDGQQGIPTAAGGRVRRTTSTLTGKSVFQYTPPAGFVGTDSFRYVVQDRGGLISPAATVTVTVEDIGISRTEFHPKLGRWHISGTTSQQTGNRITLSTGPLASLTGAGEVPPVATEALGKAGLRIRSADIDFVLQIDPLPETAVTEAYIRVGPPGQDGPILFFLYHTFFDGDFTGRKSGVLRPGDLLLRPLQGINSFADAVAAILRGDAFVSVHTVGHPDGEIRGQLLRPPIGTVDVQPGDGSLRFRGKTTAGPGPLPSVNAESLNGAVAPGLPLRLR